MKIELNIKATSISGLMSAAIESGDPVTRGWCDEIRLPGYSSENWRTTEGYGWWCNAMFFEQKSFSIIVVEIDDENTGHKTRHTLNPKKIKTGLEKMAARYGHIFSNIMEDNIDAPTADIFLQCCLFGEEKYA